MGQAQAEGYLGRDQELRTAEIPLIRPGPAEKPEADGEAFFWRGLATQLETCGGTMLQPLWAEP